MWQTWATMAIGAFIQIVSLVWFFSRQQFRNDLALSEIAKSNIELKETNASLAHIRELAQDLVRQGAVNAEQHKAIIDRLAVAEHEIERLREWKHWTAQKQTIWVEQLEEVRRTLNP